MGATESKEKGFIPPQATKDIRRQSKTQKSTKSNQIDAGVQIVNNLKSEIDIFAGNRESARYSEFHEILTTVSKDFQEVKTKTGKQQIRDQCDEALGEVQNCFQRLETRVNFNEQSDRNLDLAAIESHSFINHSFVQQNPSPPALLNQNWAQELPQPTKQRPPKFDVIDTLDRLERETNNLEKDVRMSIDLQDFSQFKVLEKKIEILYTDLEMITSESHTPLNERKSAIGKRLIKFNNQIRRAKRAAAKQDTPRKEELAKIEHKLENLEIQVLTFEGTKADKRYNELKQILEKYLITINSANFLNDNDRRKWDVTTTRIKNALQELNSIAENNEEQTAAIQNMHKIEIEVQNLKTLIEEFQGTSSDPNYLELDQSLRSFWAQLSDIEELNEMVKRNKSRIIKEIQYNLKHLSDEAKERESALTIIQTEEDKTNDEIIQTQLFKQVKEFKNHWEQLNHNLGVNKFSNSHTLISTCEIFREIINNINKKIQDLEYNSAVNVQVNEKQMPKNLSYEESTFGAFKITKPFEIEIKVQPTVKIIGEIQRVAAETKVLLQQIRQSNCSKDDTEYKIFQNKLDEYKKVLEDIPSNKGNDTIESNRRRANKLICEGYRALEEKTTKKDNEASIRSSRAYEVMDIDAEMQYLRQQIKTFTSTVKDKHYDKIKTGLTECLTKLQIIGDIHIDKQETIQQIQRYHQELETKLAENQAKLRVMEQNSEARHDIKVIVEQVQKLKSQVERFSGTHNGIQFNQIQDKLNSLTQKLNEIDTMNDDKLLSSKVQIQQKIQKYLKILDEKSIKVEIQQYQQKEDSSNEQRPNSKIEDSPHHKINFLRDKLVVVKDKTETFSGKFKDAEYVKIEKDMLGCLDDLKNIEDRGHKSVILSKQQYDDYIHKLLKYFEDKSKSKEHEDTTRFNIMDPVEELGAMEVKISEFKDNVDNFDGTPQDLVYKELNNSSITLTKNLDKIQAGNVIQVREKKRKLMEELEFATKKLEDRAGYKLEIEWDERQVQLSKIEEIKDKVRDIAKEITMFQGIKNDPTYSYLDESLIKLTIQLDNIASSKYAEVKDAKKQAIQLIQRNTNILLGKVASHGDGELSTPIVY